MLVWLQKNELFSKTPLFFFFFMYFLPLNFIFMDHHSQAADESERTRLLDANDLEAARTTRQSPREVVPQLPPPIAVSPALLTRVNLALPAAVEVKASSLESIDPQRILAQEAMNKIIDGLAYVVHPEFQAGIEEKAKAANALVVSGAFRQSLLEVSYANSTGGSLTEYLKAVRKKIIELQKLVPELRDQNVALRGHIEDLLKILQGDGDQIKGLQQVVPLLQAQIQKLRQDHAVLVTMIGENNSAHQTAASQKSEIEQLRNSNWRLRCIILPVVGLIVGGVSVTLTHFLWKT